MRLVIAEKPSVAMSLAKVLGAGARRDGYMEGGGWLVSWCVGHLVELANADAYDPRYSNVQNTPDRQSIQRHIILTGDWPSPRWRSDM